MSPTIITITISAVTALLTTYLSKRYSANVAHKDRTYERAVYLREKYEEFGDWFSAVMNDHEAFLAAKPLELTAFLRGKHQATNKLVTLAVIYFPKLKNEAKDLVIALKDTQDAIMKQIDYTNQASNIGGQLVLAKSFENIHQQFWDTRTSLATKYEELAEYYTFLSDNKKSR